MGISLAGSNPARSEFLSEGTIISVNSSCGAFIIIRARLAQSVEHQTFNLRVKGSSPLLGASFFFIKCNFFFLQPLFFSLELIINHTLLRGGEQRGAVEACWAHNPEVDGSKPSAAMFFFQKFKICETNEIPYESNAHIP